MISVAEQFGNLRDTLGSIFGIYALMRYFRITMAKLRGQPLPPDDDSLQDTDPSNQFNPHDNPPTSPISKKPLVVFLLAVFGLPYLMGKLIRAMARAKRITSSARVDLLSTQMYRAAFDFVPRRAGEVALRRGDVVVALTRGDSGWWRVRSRDGREGYVPSNYLEVYIPAQMQPQQQQGAGPIMSPPGEKGHAFIEEFKDE
jgi:peroxin-13